MKLLYISDRYALNEYAQPLTFDRYVSMNHGPVLSTTYDLMNGCAIPELQEQWDNCFEQRQNHSIKLRENCDLTTTDMIIQTVDIVWREYSHMSPWSLVEYTHANFEEWTDPKGSSQPIQMHNLLQQLGYDSGEAESIAEGIRSEHPQFNVLNLARLQRTVHEPVLELSPADNRETLRKKILDFANSN
ncbi:SocA family protein [Pseudidiomarina marina]|uniref:Panacea domain-containing protein n=1 Tax=Pseudidiomarina marina TaxID=502366 RepID=UPI00384AAE63